MNKSATAAEFTARCKAFSNEGVRENRIIVDSDDSVLVFDAVAGYYTRCHALSERQQSRLRKLARQH